MRGSSWVRVAVAVTCAALVLVVVVVAISAVTSEPRRPTVERVAVGKQDGELILFGCVPDGIGAATVSGGVHADGPAVWSVQRAAPGNGAQVIPLGPPVSGYSVVGSSPASDSDAEYNLNRLSDSQGQPLLVSVLVFRPSAIDEGSVETASGKVQQIDDWKKAVRCP